MEKKVKTTNYSNISFSRRKQFDKGVDSLVNRLSMVQVIPITIIVLSIGSLLVQNISTPAYISSMYPNYEQPNTFTPIDDPYSIDYIQYGDNVVNGLYEQVQFLGGVAEATNQFWNLITGSWIETDGGFATAFGDERWIFIATAYQDFWENGETDVHAYIAENILTLTERNWLLNTANHSLLSPRESNVFLDDRWYFIYYDSYDLFGGDIKFFFTEPSVYIIIRDY
jgi:hypothetical protein